MLDISALQSWQLNQIKDEVELTDSMRNINKAFEISRKVLQSAYNSDGIKAGQTHFSDVWVRDSCFAGWGAIELNDFKIIEDFLTTTLNNMNSKGQCPLRVGQKYFMLKYLGLKGPQGPTYIEDKYVSIPMDSNSLTIILCWKYFQQSNNDTFVLNAYNKLKYAVLWYKNHKDNNLIVEGNYAGWADSIKKKGHVLYTNVLYYQALLSMSKIAEKLNIKTDLKNFAEDAEKVKKAINNVFWNGTYCNDWVDGKKVKKTFSLDGNMLAILFNVIDEKKSKITIEYLIKENIITSIGVPVVYKKYNATDVYPAFLFIGLKKYHNGLYWFWISCITSIALINNGFEKEGLDLLDTLSNRINEDETVYEVYRKNGKPFKNLFYKSEEGFAWSAGLFVWAVQELSKRFK